MTYSRPSYEDQIRLIKQAAHLWAYTSRTYCRGDRLNDPNEAEKVLRSVAIKGDRQPRRTYNLVFEWLHLASILPDVMLSYGHDIDAVHAALATELPGMTRESTMVHMRAWEVEQTSKRTVDLYELV